MKKQEEEQKVIYELEDFESQCHLWSIVPGGSGKGIVKLRKIVDSIQAGNFTNPYKKLPSFLIVGDSGTGKNIVVKAIVNSLILTDVRECHARYLDNGIHSTLFFKDSLHGTAHIVTNIEHLTVAAESVLWRYLKHGFCKYFNYSTREFDLVQQCNGMIAITARNKSKISQSILGAVDHVIELEQYTQEQVKIIVHQLLSVFCKIPYDGEQVLQEIVNEGVGMIGLVIEFLKECIMVMKAEMLDCLDMEVIEKAKRIWVSNAPIGPPPPQIPF